MIPKPCIDCGQLTPATRCPTCQRTRERTRSAARPPRPHYAGNYDKRAKAIRDTATSCWICGQGPQPGNPWQADHINPGDPHSPLAAAHRSCNITRSNRERTNRGGD